MIDSDELINEMLFVLPVYNVILFDLSPYEITNLLSQFITLFGSWHVCSHSWTDYPVTYQFQVLPFKKDFQVILSSHYG